MLIRFSARAAIYIKERRFIEAKSWLPHGRINKNVIFIPLCTEYSLQIPVETLKSSFRHTHKLESTVIPHNIEMWCLHMAQCCQMSRQQTQFLPLLHLNSTSEMHFRHMIASLLQI